MRPCLAYPGRKPEPQALLVYPSWRCSADPGPSSRPRSPPVASARNRLNGSHRSRSPSAAETKQWATVGEAPYDPAQASLYARTRRRTGARGRPSSTTSPGSRLQCWALLRAAVRDRMTQIAGGQITEWWAWHQGDGSQMAVVLGPAALCQADPGIKPDGNPGHRMRTARFVPGSLRVTASGDPMSGSAIPAGAPGTAVPPLLAGVLSADFKSFLGNLPRNTQVQVQRPFAPQPDLLYRFYYEDMPGSPHTWIGLCYITDEHTLTFASTTRVIAPSGRPAPGRPPATRRRWPPRCLRPSWRQQVAG